MFEKLNQYVNALDIKSISSERQHLLAPFVAYIKRKLEDGDTILLNFICTHNSRRSHLAQIWSQAMADYFNLTQIQSYSGGTNATAIYPVVIKTLQNVGFQSVQLSQSENPVFAIKYRGDAPPIISFSKTYDHPFNPSMHFGSVMTCSEADENCPFIAGTEKRISLRYEDPKIYDNSPLQEVKYEERCRQIATEMFYVFSQIT